MPMERDAFRGCDYSKGVCRWSGSPLRRPGAGCQFLAAVLPMDVSEKPPAAAPGENMDNQLLHRGFKNMTNLSRTEAHVTSFSALQRCEWEVRIWSAIRRTL